MSGGRGGLISWAALRSRPPTAEGPPAMMAQVYLPCKSLLEGLWGAGHGGKKAGGKGGGFGVRNQSTLCWCFCIQEHPQ